MSYMSDERYEFIQDVKEKSFTARSAHNRRGACGKGGRAIMPSDHYTKKQLESMNGEIKIYRLGEPMTWDEFNAMPDDLQREYIVRLRKQFNVPDERLADAFGIKSEEFNSYISKFRLRPCKAINEICNWYDTDDCVRFTTWWVSMKGEYDV